MRIELEPRNLAELQIVGAAVTQIQATRDAAAAEMHARMTAPAQPCAGCNEKRGRGRPPKTAPAAAAETPPVVNNIALVRDEPLAPVVDVLPVAQTEARTLPEPLVDVEALLRAHLAKRGLPATQALLGGKRLSEITDPATRAALAVSLKAGIDAAP